MIKENHKIKETESGEDSLHKMQKMKENFKNKENLMLIQIENFKSQIKNLEKRNQGDFEGDLEKMRELVRH